MSDSDVSDNEIEDVNDWSTAPTSDKGRPKTDSANTSIVSFEKISDPVHDSGSKGELYTGELYMMWMLTQTLRSAKGLVVKPQMRKLQIYLILSLQQVLTLVCLA